MNTVEIKDKIRSKGMNYSRENRKISQQIEENEQERKRIEERIEEVDRILESMKREKEDMFILADKLDTISKNLERNRLQEYLHLVNNKKKLFFMNFIMGLAKGFGTVVGFTVLAAIALYILQSMISLPIIGDFVAEIVKIVQQNLAKK